MRLLKLQSRLAFIKCCRFTAKLNVSKWIWRLLRHCLLLKTRQWRIKKNPPPSQILFKPLEGGRKINYPLDFSWKKLDAPPPLSSVINRPLNITAMYTLCHQMIVTPLHILFFRMYPTCIFIFYIHTIEFKFGFKCF